MDVRTKDLEDPERDLKRDCLVFEAYPTIKRQFIRRYDTELLRTFFVN